MVDDAERVRQIEALLDRAERRTYRGRLPSPPARAVRVTNDSCGDVLDAYLLLEPHGAPRLAFEVTGCTVAQAGGDAAADKLSGVPLESWPTVADEAVLAMLGAPVRARPDCALLGLRAFRSLASPAQQT